MVDRVPRVAWLMFAVLAVALPGAAEEWYESYRSGVRALAQGDARRAVTFLEVSAGQRPRPGRDVLTYGTNIEHEYYPYLRLAEAYLQLRDPAGARSALERSERWGIESAAERKRLAARLEELVAALAPPSPAPLPAPSPAIAVIVPPVPTTVATPPPVTMATPTPAPAVVVPPAAARATPSSPEPRRASAPPSPAAIERPATAPSEPPRILEVLSQPTGAAVYLDDELIGTTDPDFGRLARTGVAPGRHRIRLSRAGYEDLAEDVLVADSGRTDFRRRLSPTASTVDRRLVLFGTVATVLLALTGWALWRSGRSGGQPAGGFIYSHTPAPHRGTPIPAPTPGVRRDAAGREFFGDYRLLDVLGRGGMASVFRAERGTEQCALKRPLPAFLDEPEFLERFQREAEIGRTLHHPNIIRILERGEVEGVPYFTMELVPGETLHALVAREGALDPRRAARIVAHIAEALDYAHLKGVVHRDLKPSNAMVLPDGTAKVMDYGIARARRFEGLTTTGSFLGSPEYVAPETIEGRGTDPRSDLYSLGVMFYEVLTGRRPFAAETPFGILRKHLTEAPVPPSAVRPGIPPDLDRIVLRLLSKTPEGRHPAAEDLILEIRDFLNRAA